LVQEKLFGVGFERDDALFFQTFRLRLFMFPLQLQIIPPCSGCVLLTRQAFFFLADLFPYDLKINHARANKTLS